MLLRAISVVTTVLVALSLAAVPAHAYTPGGGPRFNNPYGGADAKNRSMVHIKRSIDSAPRGSVIRIASYSYDRREFTDALIRACNRKVAVQVVLNDNYVSPQAKRLRTRLGTNIEPRAKDRCNPRPAGQAPHPEPSFLVVCEQSCRVGAGNQHIKLFMFSRAGSARNVIMTGSTNLTYYAAKTHWNDLWTMRGNGAQFADYSARFRELAQDRRLAVPYWRATHGDITTEFGPKTSARGNRSQDPLVQRLNRVGCRATGGTGVGGRTAIRISMYAWGGDRGLYLARRVADLRRKGCNVRVILSGASKPVKTALRNGGVSMRSAAMNTDRNTSTGFGTTPWEHFPHEKWMTLSGTFEGRARRIVWTGSENWSDISLLNDELTVTIPRATAVGIYNRHFNGLWSSSRYTRPL